MYLAEDTKPQQGGRNAATTALCWPSVAIFGGDGDFLVPCFTAAQGAPLFAAGEGRGTDRLGCRNRQGIEVSPTLASQEWGTMLIKHGHAEPGERYG